MITFRNYQQSIFEQIVNSDDDVVFQLETGAGKTAIIDELARRKPTITVAHRNMLVEQISNTHTRSGLNHKVIANGQITKRCQLYQRNNGANYSGDVWVASVRSLASWFKRGKLAIDKIAIEQVIIDEVHHVAEGNQWAELRNIFPNARFIGATATPCRLDGRGLHKDCGGLFDRLVQAEQLRKKSTQWLIANSYLSDYEYWCPPTKSFDIEKLKRSNVGDYTIESIDSAINRDTICGEVIEHYKKLADNKTAIVYCSVIDRSIELVDELKKNGYSAACIHSKMTLAENLRRLDAFKRGEIKILINVEMITEGFDMPEAQCVILLRPTASLNLFKQMIGRVLRTKKDGSKAIIIDHVSNVIKHGLPDDEIVWTLTGVPKNKSEKVVACDICGTVNNIYLKSCKKCGHGNPLLLRSHHIALLEKLGIIDVELVRKVRSHFKQLEIAEERERAALEHELSIKTKIHMPVWRNNYGNNAVGELCKKLTDWFVLNLADSGLSIAEINKFTLGKQPPVDFWASNFSMKALKTSQPKKCREVLKLWL